MHRDAGCRKVGWRSGGLDKNYFTPSYVVLRLFFFGHWQWRIQEATGPLAGVRRITSDIAFLDNLSYLTLWGSVRLNRLPSMRLSIGHGSSGQPMDELPHWTFGSSTFRTLVWVQFLLTPAIRAGAGGPCTQVQDRRERCSFDSRAPSKSRENPQSQLEASWFQEVGHQWRPRFFPLCKIPTEDIMMDVQRAAGAAQRRLRAWQRHLRIAVQLALEGSSTTPRVLLT